MNYFVTHCDKKYIKYAERLFESLEKDSENKILFFSVDFDYKNRFKNVINIKYDALRNFKEKRNDLYKPFRGDSKSFHVFIKPLIVEGLLDGKYAQISSDDNFCYLDADCFSRKECDSIFKNAQTIKKHPLLSIACQQYMLCNGRGNPFANGKEDPNLCLEAPLLKELGIDVSLRIPVYLQTGVFMFNKKCIDFVREWSDLCFSNLVLNNREYLAPFHEETVINCLLWRDKVKDNLGQSLINVIEGGKKELKEMMHHLENPSQELQRITNHCTIPAKSKINDLYFFHRRVTDQVYKFLTQKMRKLYLKVNSPSLGDTLAVTPTLRKLSKTYESLITVVTHHKNIFHSNPYVDEILSFDEFQSLKTEDCEIFETFLGIGHKNHLGVEKKHNTIDIRQFHSIDLGFCLSSDEMEYDYTPDNYVQIKDLPSSYVVLHVGSTWPSRTYSKDNWQQLINLLNYHNISVVLVGKNDHETGFYDIDKKTINLSVNLGLDLTNQLTLSQCWHVIDKAACLITMDSGLLHLAGTTDTYIVQLGSSLNNELRAPFRKGSQNYKYKYISGPCGIFCASDIKYGVKEWGTIQGVPPLINCLENKPTFECHPAPQNVFDFVASEIVEKHNVLNYVDFSYENNRLALNYSLSDSKYAGKYNIVIEEEGSGIVIYQELVNISHAGVNFWTDFTFAKSKMNENFKVRVLKNNSCVFEKNFSYPHFNPSNPLVELGNKLQNFDLSGVSLGVLSEVFIDNNYDEGLVKVSEGDVVVDIGFNVGLFSVKSFLEGAKKIYAVEPNEENISKFKSINKNKVIDNLHISNIAISDHDGTDSFLIDEDYDNSGRSMLEKTLHSGRTSFNSHSYKTVKTQKFQTFLEENNIDKIDLLKIDCEGGELFILHEDNRKIFEDKVDKVVGEIHFSLDTEQGSYMKNFLEETGFEFSIDAGPDPAGLITFSALKKKNKKIVFLAPHLSTGGSPAYLLWLIREKIKQGYEAFVIEYCYYGNYIVHRNKIIDLIGKNNFFNFAALNDSDEVFTDRTDFLIQKIRDINPSEIHLNEIGENFSLKQLTEKLKSFLYSPERKFKIYETCHTSEFDFKDKVLMPDEFYFCTPYHLKSSNHLNVPKKVVEMQIDKQKKPDRDKTLISLGLDPNKYHVLQVGLFQENKNQKFTFDLAKQFINAPIQFHFVGNICFIDDCGIDKEQQNCKIWGEKDNVDIFMSCMDLFVMPSVKELNPISIKEALSWGMPCFVSKIETLQSQYENMENVEFIDGLNLFNYIKGKIKPLMSESKFLDLHSNTFSVNREDDIVKVEIMGHEVCDYEIKFVDLETYEILYQTKITNGMWSSCASNSKLKVLIYNCITCKTETFWPDDLNIINESGSLGDALAWVPVVNEFTKLKTQKVNFFTPYANIFDKNEYPNIKFKNYNQIAGEKELENTKRIGCFYKESLSVPLQDLPCEILSIPKLKNNIRPKIDKSFITKRPFEKKYVCIASHSTAQLKYWNNEVGWKQVIKYLKEIGYEVICLDRDRDFGNDQKMNSIPEDCIHYPGESLADIINCLHYCEFFIGLSSGLSWLAWSCFKPVVMICGFLEKEYHFDEAYYVQNKNVCNCCWNKGKHFDSSNWMWCPENKDFECSKEISFEMVKNNIDNLISNNNL